VIDAETDLPSLIASLEDTLANGAIVFLGAGSITQWAHGLEAAMTKRKGA
jgi:UDP-N-acetylmuramate-alanine ligase